MERCWLIYTYHLVALSLSLRVKIFEGLLLCSRHVFIFYFAVISLLRQGFAELQQLFGFDLFCLRLSRHSAESRSDSLRWTTKLGSAFRSTMLRSMEPCQTINSPSMFCNSALLYVFVERKGTSSTAAGRPWLNMK